ncbi:MAG: DUF1292 domain-containing protein [Clostridia bacterium]|nr:DUF1292 domain-containing protein [Clostridia bacterium]
MEEMDNIIALTDDEGNEVEFEFLDLIEYDGKEYVVLLPLDDDEGQVVILLIENADTDEESYASVDDDEELMQVFNLFKEKNKDEFNFND